MNKVNFKVDTDETDIEVDEGGAQLGHDPGIDDLVAFLSEEKERQQRAARDAVTCRAM